ncbi:hypothetical protein TWF694_006127 [Orbilia ellipsospora]|uniref:Nicotinamide N-methyltransferase n=1 Tax=Orbilia ellipsospora TaxID=2528407 RepID=A0AAV9WRB3_9PEZI
MLTTRITELANKDNPVEDVDIFESSLTTIFNDVRNMHGEPGEFVVYTSPKYGDIKLGLANIRKSDTRLFSHHLWNAGVEVAGMIENGEIDVEEENVLELGAGAALPSLLSALAGARSVVITDYPAPEILENITSNICLNSTILSSSKPPEVYGHTWGDLSDDVAKAYTHAFTRVIAADTLWMDYEHENLAKSMLHFLDDKNPKARVIVVAGLHTGRQKMAKFWNVAVDTGFEIESIKERDVNGVEREFLADRGFEDGQEKKMWLTIGILKRKSS